MEKEALGVGIEIEGTSQTLHLGRLQMESEKIFGSRRHMKTQRPVGGLACRRSQVLLELQWVGAG